MDLPRVFVYLILHLIAKSISYTRLNRHDLQQGLFYSLSEISPNVLSVDAVCDVVRLPIHTPFKDSSSSISTN